MMKVTDYFNDIQCSIVNSKLLMDGDFRLNPEYYEAIAANNLPHHINSFLLGSKADISHPGITKREYVESKKNAIPFLSTSELQFYEAIEGKYVSTFASKNLQDYIVSKNTILVSRSGTIGNVSIVDKFVDKCAVSEHAIRICLKEKNYIGLVYTYLNSKTGQKVLKGQKSGAVIDEIYDNDVAALQIPDIDLSVVNQINDLVMSAVDNREKAFSLIQQARSLVLRYNNLPELDSVFERSTSPEIIFSISNNLSNDFRLDAHYHNNIAQTIYCLIEQSCNRQKFLFELADCTFNGSRTTRNYVNEENGIPFLSGKNIVQIRPDYKYISKTETENLIDMIVSKNQILVTRVGTLARTVLVYENYEGCAASEHMIRVSPKQDSIDSAYLYAFLSSDYGYYQMLRFKHGAVIDVITEDQIGETVIPLPSSEQQKEIGDIVRQAYHLRAEAIRLEDQAQALLQQAITNN